MIKKFQIFDNLQNNDWINKYILCVPSGEVISIDGIDIHPLISNGYIYYDYMISGNSKEPGYMCNDFMSNKVKIYINENSNKNKDVLNIKIFLKECGLSENQYVINVDKSVDLYGPLNMSYMKLRKIPFKFNKCTSDFRCAHNYLETLENCPFTVHGTFDCSFNSLKNLIGGPKLVSNVYKCNNNLLESLKGSPLKLKYFDCSYNYLTDLNNAPIVSNHFIKNNNLFNGN